MLMHLSASVVHELELFSNVIHVSVSCVDCSGVFYKGCRSVLICNKVVLSEEVNVVPNTARARFVSAPFASACSLTLLHHE